MKTEHMPKESITSGWLQNEYDNPIRHTQTDLSGLTLFVRVHQIKLSILHFLTHALSVRPSFLLYRTIQHFLRDYNRNTLDLMPQE
jgi:hypothetical protein